MAKYLQDISHEIYHYAGGITTQTCAEKYGDNVYAGTKQRYGANLQLLTGTELGCVVLCTWQLALQQLNGSDWHYQDCQSSCNLILSTLQLSLSLSLSFSNPLAALLAAAPHFLMS